MVVSVWVRRIFSRPPIKFDLSRRIIRSAAFFVVSILAGCDIGRLILTADPRDPPPEPAIAREPLLRDACAHVVKERQPLFGDLHLHTSLSMDANSLGTRTLPDDAYAYATGTSIALYGGAPGAKAKTIQIDRPLDFAAVTDHAEWMAEVSLRTTPGSRSYDSTGCSIHRGEQESLLAKALGTKGFRARIGGLIEVGAAGRMSVAKIRQSVARNSEMCGNHYRRRPSVGMTDPRTVASLHSLPGNTVVHLNPPRSIAISSCATRSYPSSLSPLWKHQWKWTCVINY